MTSLLNFLTFEREAWSIIVFVKSSSILNPDETSEKNRQPPNSLRYGAEKNATSKRNKSPNVSKRRGTKDTKGTVKLINLKQTDNAMAKNEKDKQKNNSTHDTT